MGEHLLRGMMLLEQSRPDLAEAEFRQELLESPSNPHAHAYLALCLAGREKLDEATEEARQAIAAAPDLAFAHHIHGAVLRDRNRFDEAASAAEEAIRLEPEEASYHGLLAQVRLDQRRWPSALESAERGLALDPEDTHCRNLRSVALMQLGRKDEARQAADGTLARKPEDSMSHTTRGWTLLDEGRAKEALEHFREALRLRPGNEWARQGIVEALKARHFVYRWMLRYFLWMGKLSRRAQWMIILGFPIGLNLLRGLAGDHPALVPLVTPISIAYTTFAILTWIANPVYTLLLRLSRFGRLALSPDQVAMSNCVGFCFLGAFASIGLWWYAGAEYGLLGVVFFALMIPPVAGIYHCDRGWPRAAMAGLAGVIAAAGVASLWIDATLPAGAPDSRLGYQLFMTFLFGALLSPLAVNALAMVRPRR